MINSLCHFIDRILSTASVSMSCAKFGSKSKVAGRCYLIRPDRIAIGNNVEIGYDVILNAGGEPNKETLDYPLISIEDNVQLSNRVIINSCYLDMNNHTEHHAKPVWIQKNAWVASGAIINAGVTIGENSIVASGAVVIDNVPNNVLVAGVPAKVIKGVR